MTDHDEHVPPTEAELAQWELHDIPQMNRLIAEVRRLRAERSADSERLDWVEQNTRNLHMNEQELGRVRFATRRDGGEWGEYVSTLREAIDAARREPTP